MTTREVAQAAVDAIAKYDTLGRVRPRIVDAPAGPRVMLGASLESYAYVTREGKVRLSPGVPLRWRGNLRLALQHAGVYGGHAGQMDVVMTKHAVEKARGG